MALIGELNEFHKTRRRGLRRRKRNHHYVQKYMEIDKGRDSRLDLKNTVGFINLSNHQLYFFYLKPSKLAQGYRCYAKFSINVSDTGCCNLRLTEQNLKPTKNTRTRLVKRIQNAHLRFRFCPWQIFRAQHKTSITYSDIQSLNSIGGARYAAASYRHLQGTMIFMAN